MWQTVKGWFKRPRSTAAVERAHPSWWQHADSDVVLVFVHGLLSDGTQCWTAPSGAYWPSLIKEDPAINRCSVFVAQYYTGVDSGSYDVAQCAGALFDSLKDLGANGIRVLDYSRVVFVCHSLGGIVTRRMLEENSRAFTQKRVGLVLLASPTLGSNYAYWFKPLSAIYGNKVVQALIPSDEMLVDLDQRFLKLLNEKVIPDLVGAEACEHHGPGHFKWLPKLFKAVVPPESASRYFGPRKILHGTDHSGIAKPDSLEHPSARFLRNFLLENFLLEGSQRGAASSRVSPVPRENDAPKSAHVLFDVYTSTCRSYYIERPVDKELFENLGMGNIWLTGASGSGKTAAARRYLDQKNLPFVEISLSVLGRGLTVERLMHEIHAVLGMTTESRGLSEIAREICRRRIHLVLDEVPIAPGNSSKIIEEITLLSEALSRFGNGHSRLLACSIEPPDFNGLGTKRLEHLHVMNVPMWLHTELQALAQLIESELPDLVLESSMREEVLAAAGHAPRFVKTFYRYRVRFRAMKTQQECLALTRESFVHHGD